MHTSYLPRRQCGQHCYLPEISGKNHFEPPNEKTNNLHMRNQRRRSASNCEADQRIWFSYRDSTGKVQFLYFLNPKFPASSCFLCLCSVDCVRPVWANLRNIFVSPYPTLFPRCGSVGWNIILFYFLRFYID